MGRVRFGVPRELVAGLRAAFGLRTFVETGTHLGATAAWAATSFERVVTIEGDEALHRKAAASLRHLPNVEAVHGDSARVLRHMTVPGPALYWLDAHWCGDGTFGAGSECPLLAEVEAVSSRDPDAFVLVDDARYFLAPPPPPHDASQWPSIATLCAALSWASGYVAVHEDVIVRVPSRAQDWLVGFLREDARRNELRERARSATLSARALGRLRRLARLT